MKIIAVIPAYNESKTISQVVREVGKLVDKVIVVDDGSEDKTGRLAKETGALVLSHLINRGQGASLQTGTEYALKIGAEIIVHFDADGQFEPKDINKAVEPIKSLKVDIVFGSRFKGSHHDMPIIKRWVLKGGTIFNFLFTGIKLTDAHCGLRALSQKAAKKLILSQDRMAHATEYLQEVKRHHLKFKEVPVSVKYTDYSKNKGQSAWNAFKILWELVTGKIIR